MQRLTDRPDMTLDVYRGRKTTTQQQQQSVIKKHKIVSVWYNIFQTNTFVRDCYIPFVHISLRIMAGE